VLAIDLRPGPFQSTSGHDDMKLLSDKLVNNDVELAAHCVRAARTAVTGGPG
jgi:hypothetical protein